MNLGGVPVRRHRYDDIHQFVVGLVPRLEKWKVGRYQMAWQLDDWEEYIVRNWTRWEARIAFTTHEKWQSVKDADRIFACENCLNVFTDVETDDCDNPSHYPMSQSPSNEQAKRAFVRVWINALQPRELMPEKDMNVRGTDTELTDDEAFDYQFKLRSNIESLIDEAMLLFDNSFRRRAGFLALVALEETMKMGWFSIFHINKDRSHFIYPLYGCKPGFTYKRVWLVYKGLRHRMPQTEREREESAGGLREKFRFVPGQNMENHLHKLQMAVDPRNTFLGSSSLLELENTQKYYTMYKEFHQNDDVLEYCRYIDIDFDHSCIPELGMTQQQAFDHILFASAMLPDWAEHAGYRNFSQRDHADESANSFIARNQDKYKAFLERYSDISSDIFPSAALTDEERQILISDGMN